MTPLLGQLLGQDKRQYEYVFSADAVTTFTEQSGVEDWRVWSDKVLFRKLEPHGPAWTASPEGAEFSAGGGALGVASLWTRPVRLEAGLRLESAHLQFLERRTLEGGSGGVALVVHVRDRPVVGEGSDVFTKSIPLHANSDAEDESWHGVVVDVLDVLAEHLASDRYVTFEVRVESLKGAPSKRAIVVGLKPISLTLVCAPPQAP